MKQKNLTHETWLELSDAAKYLGVHFTTLRRWADIGEIACTRTPGGRRRFSVKSLDLFLERMAVCGKVKSPCEAEPVALAVQKPTTEQTILHARQSVQKQIGAEGWMERMSENQRLMLKGTGHHLMALLLQFNARVDGGDVFLEEGKRIASVYSQVCSQVGLSLQETVNVFLLFRRTMIDTIHETGYIGGGDDPEGQRLFHRSNEFLDVLLIDLISAYQETQQPISN